ncbi:MAG: lactococcin 972 family bacteriocin [Staphylococcus rostri]|uniref:lactococcin 972 family bacteriocin n=1 Tax=Staphylococcus rostri TaxID=522262 RepID=UPI0026DF79EF|nr:lactococcin 972 family bacteriocin [Staphylococcus rostri]MDO5376045.1 lactococcin 972 family bacteriocin [Staphylococcus rostri]
MDNYNGLVRSEVLDQPSTQDGTALRKITSGSKDGGYWIRGTNSTKVISKYKHYKKAGRASVVNKYGEYRDGGWKKAGVFSSAQVRKTSSGNKAYYDHK